MPIRFFYFDLGNVLLTFDHHRGARQMAAVADTSEEAMWSAVFATDLQCRYEAGQVTCDEFYEAVCRATGTRADRDKLLDAAGAIFEANVRIFPIVAALQAAGHRTGILSNTCKCHWDYCIAGRYGMIPGAFEQIVLSYEVGAMKPEPPVYKAAIERAGVAPAEIFFIDDREENVAAAKAAGMDAVLYCDPPHCAEDLHRRAEFNY